MDWLEELIWEKGIENEVPHYPPEAIPNDREVIVGCKFLAFAIRKEIRKQADKFIEADMRTGKHQGAIKAWDERILKSFLAYLKGE